MSTTVFSAKRNYSKSSHFLLLLLCFTVTIITWIRLSYGVDITDESFYIADAYMVTQGAVPFVSTLFVPGHLLSFSWLVSLFTSISGGTEGIMFFMRCAYLIVTLLIVVAVYFLLRSSVNKGALLCFLVILIPIAPYNIYAFSYNTLPPLLLLFSGALIIASMNTDSIKRARLFCIISGFFSAFVIISYPTLFFVIASIIIIFFIYQKYYNEPLSLPLFYMLSTLATGMVVLASLVVAGGSWGAFQNGLDLVLNNPSRAVDSYSFSERMDLTFKEFGMMGRFLLFVLCFFAILHVLYLIPAFRRRALQSVPVFEKAFVVYSLVGGAAFFIFSLILESASATSYSLVNHVSLALFVIPPVLLFFIKNYKILATEFLLFVWLPFVLQWFIIVLSTTGMQWRWYILFFDAALSTFFLYFALRDLSFKKNKKSRDPEARFSKINKVFLSIFIGTLLFCVTFASWTFVYRDSSFSKMNYMVGSGVYKGLRTTSEKGENLIALEKELRSITSSGETVLFMETVPMAYLMTDAAPCAPSSWDIMAYTYGMNDDLIMYQYFAQVGAYPDKIIYINSGRDKIVSIDSEGYKFNSFVNANYSLTYTNDSIGFPLKVYSKNYLV